MSHLLSYAQQRVYKLDEALQEKPEYGTWTTTLSANEQDLLLTKLGPRAWGRMLLFTKYYTAGWGEGNKQVSPRGQAIFLRFLEHVTFRDEADPSIFLTDEGELELAWSDTNGRAVQLVFGPNGVEVYHEAARREEVVAPSQYARLANEFSNV